MLGPVFEEAAKEVKLKFPVSIFKNENQFSLFIVHCHDQKLILY